MTMTTKKRDRTFDKFFRMVNWRDFRVDDLGHIRVAHPVSSVCPLADALGQTDSYNVLKPSVDQQIVPHRDAGQQIIAAADNMTGSPYFLPRLRKRMLANMKRKQHE